MKKSNCKSKELIKDLEKIAALGLSSDLRGKNINVFASNSIGFTSVKL